MNRIFVTGDTHGRFDRIFWQIESGRLVPGDIIVIMGDAGVNYYEDERDQELKSRLNESGLMFLLVRGNHEARPHGDSYLDIVMHLNEFEGNVLIEAEYPMIMYLKDGESYLFHFDDGSMKKALVVGGAYSVDKFHRLDMQQAGYPDFKWFPDEQLTPEERKKILRKVKGQYFDYVFTHSVPYNMRPVDMFLPMIAQSTVDESTERFLQELHDSIQYGRWYAGHWHTDRVYPDCNLRLLFHDTVWLGD